MSEMDDVLSAFLAEGPTEASPEASPEVPPLLPESPQHTLPQASDEQAHVALQLFKGQHVAVDSVAGSGKTTCVLHICRAFPHHHILCLTYNARLRKDTRQKAKWYDVHNLSTHTFHSFAAHLYNTSCIDDVQLYNVMQEPVQRTCAFDIVILDETQDMCMLMYHLVWRLLACNQSVHVPHLLLCILGDTHQSIYSFKHADSRFISMAPGLFPFPMDAPAAWSRCTLRTSFRVSSGIATFINRCMLGTNRMAAHREGPPPRYLRCDVFGDQPFAEVCRLLDMGVSAGQIFVLTPSVRSPRSPARVLTTMIERNRPDVSIAIADGRAVDEIAVQNQLLIATFHAAKGLERSACIVLGFDDSYFEFYDRTDTPKTCPNALYVAVTRASTHLTLIHGLRRSYLPFLRTSQLAACCQLEGPEPQTWNLLPNAQVTEVAPEQMAQAVEIETYHRIVRFFTSETSPPPVPSVPFRSNVFCRVSLQNGSAQGELTGLSLVDSIQGVDSRGCVWLTTRRCDMVHVLILLIWMYMQSRLDPMAPGEGVIQHPEGCTLFRATENDLVNMMEILRKSQTSRVSDVSLARTCRDSRDSIWAELLQKK